MKNYYINLRKFADSDFEPITELDGVPMVRRYEIVKDSPYVSITYMAGEEKSELIDVSMLDYIKESQLKAFDAICDDVEKKSKSYCRKELFLPTLYFTNAGLQLAYGNTFAFGCWLLGGVSYSISYLISPLRLIREIENTKWIIENKEKVDAVIQEDRKKAYHYEYQEDALAPITTITGELHYPEELYEEGINLNNIELLSAKEIKKLKKKAKRRKEV